MTNNISDTFGDPDFTDELTDDEALEVLTEHLDYLNTRIDNLRDYHGQHDQKKHGKRGASTGKRGGIGGFFDRKKAAFRANRRKANRMLAKDPRHQAQKRAIKGAIKKVKGAVPELGNFKGRGVFDGGLLGRFRRRQREKAAKSKNQ